MRIPINVTPELAERIDSAVETRQKKGEKMTRTSWIIEAMEAQLKRDGGETQIGK